MVEFQNISLNQIIVLIQSLLNVHDKRIDFIKSIYNRQAQHFDDVYELLITQKLVKESDNKVQLTRKANKFINKNRINKTNLKNELITNLTNTKTDISDYVNRYLGLFKKVKNVYYHNPILAIRGETSGIRNLFIELGVISYNSEKDYYLLRKRFEHLSEKISVSSTMSPKKLKQLNDRKERLGLLAEKEIISFEKSRLSKHPSLIKKINHISLKNVAAGYDIESFEIPKKKKFVKRYIEVKAVSSETFRFFWSRQEMASSKFYENNYYLYLLPVVGKNTFDIEKLEIIRNPSIKILKGDKWLSQIENMSFAKKELVQK
jgi:hypothetical protein|tara:strand:+ start:3236 stop:4192 length:957 start_codon:yes stop_codon:yes gene_type:complete